MSAESNIIVFLKQKLRSGTKIKLIKEKELIALRNKERVMNDELANIIVEKELLKEQVEESKHEIVQAKHQISMIDICSISEKIKIQAHINNVTTHSKSFQDLFEKEQKEKEAIVEEFARQHEIDAMEQNEQQAREIAAVETEYEAIEQECAVLQKRNNAIMLKLRRKLLDSENLRRKLMKRCEDEYAGETSHN